MVNAFLYSVYGQPRRTDIEQLLKRTARYRKRWLDALLDDTDVEAVVAFGAIAEQAFLGWRRTATGKRFEGHFEPLTHPTLPDATARPGSANYRAAMKRLLDEWNAGLARLDEALGSNRDRKRTLASYGDELQPDDRKQIPEHDMPPGTPPGCARSSSGRRAKAQPPTPSAPRSKSGSPRANAPGNNPPHRARHRPSAGECWPRRPVTFLRAPGAPCPSQPHATTTPPRAGRRKLHGAGRRPRPAP